MTLSLRASLLAFFASTALACGASTPPAAGPADEHAEHHGDHKGGGHPKLTGAAHEFHETLAPLWHAPKGPEREVKVCDAVPTFEQRAADVLKEAPEGGDAAARTAAQGLVTSVGDLKTECAKPVGGRTDFDAKLSTMHDAFHKVAEAKH